MISDLVKDHAKMSTMEKMYKVLNVSKSGQYQWKTATISQRLQKKTILKEKITALNFETKRRYGSPRIKMELNILGYKISRIIVAKYMRELGLKSKLSKKFKIIIDSKINYLLVENVLNRQFLISQLSKA